jgi:hypothetical protein
VGLLVCVRPADTHTHANSVGGSNFKTRGGARAVFFAPRRSTSGNSARVKTRRENAGKPRTATDSYFSSMTTTDEFFSNCKRVKTEEDECPAFAGTTLEKTGKLLWEGRRLFEMYSGIVTDVKHFFCGILSKDFFRTTRVSCKSFSPPTPTPSSRGARLEQIASGRVWAAVWRWRRVIIFIGFFFLYWIATAAKAGHNICTMSFKGHARKGNTGQVFELKDFELEVRSSRLPPPLNEPVLSETCQLVIT